MHQSLEVGGRGHPSPPTACSVGRGSARWPGRLEGVRVADPRCGISWTNPQCPLPCAPAVGPGPTASFPTVTEHISESSTGSGGTSLDPGWLAPPWGPGDWQSSPGCPPRCFPRCSGSLQTSLPAGGWGRATGGRVLCFMSPRGALGGFVCQASAGTCQGAMSKAHTSAPVPPELSGPLGNKQIPRVPGPREPVPLASPTALRGRSVPRKSPGLGQGPETRCLCGVRGGAVP